MPPMVACHRAEVEQQIAAGRRQARMSDQWRMRVTQLNRV